MILRLRQSNLEPEHLPATHPDGNLNAGFQAIEPEGADQANGYFGGTPPYQLMKQFPWQHLQALRTQLSCC